MLSWISAHQGALNLSALYEDGLITLSDLPVVKQYKLFKDNWGVEWACVGQMLDGKPDGFARCIRLDGSMIYEGDVKKGQRNGFGRLILEDKGYWIGWWKDGELHGNSRYYNMKGVIAEEAWHEG